MPTRLQHAIKAGNNEAFANSLDVTSSVGIEWAITATFYAAVDFVQAYFAPNASFTSHRHRNSAIQRDAKIKGIYVDYRELETYSRDARYDEPGFGAMDLAAAKGRLANIRTCIQPLL